MRMVNCGGATLNRLRAVHLKASGGCSREFKNSPTDEYDPWRLSFCETGLDLSPVTVVFRVVSSRKTCKVGVNLSKNKARA